MVKFNTRWHRAEFIDPVKFILPLAANQGQDLEHIRNTLYTHRERVGCQSHSIGGTEESSIAP